MHFTIKPVSFTCNLKCDYCFYLPKGTKQNILKAHKMDEQVLKRFIYSYIEAQIIKAQNNNTKPNEVHVLFTWQGGEPLLCGIDFYRQAFNYQKEVKDQFKDINLIIENAIQTNGTLIDEKYCQLFKEENILIGISIDGDENIHNQYRIKNDGSGSFQEVMRGINLLKQYNIEFNTLTCINHSNYQHGLEVYNFLKNIVGAKFMQFSEVVETTPEHDNMQIAHDNYTIKPFSLPHDAYSTFMSPIFKQWVKEDIGNIHIRQFESLISAMMGLSHTSCVFENCCPDNFVIEANGDIYECDQTVYERYKIANILDVNLDLNKLHASNLNLIKQNLPQECKTCTYLILCNGGCVKHRFIKATNALKSYFCSGYKAFFKEITPYLNVMTSLEDQRIPYIQIKTIVPQIEKALNANKS